MAGRAEKAAWAGQTKWAGLTGASLPKLIDRLSTMSVVSDKVE